jgi:hypothetical protein
VAFCHWLSAKNLVTLVTVFDLFYPISAIMT